MRIHFERSGGFAAAAMKRSCTVDTENLPDDEACELNALVASSGVTQLAAPPAAPSAARDVFHYRLTIEDSGRQHSVAVSDTNMPESLRPLVNWLKRRASSG